MLVSELVSRVWTFQIKLSINTTLNKARFTWRDLLLNMEAGTAHIVESTINDDHHFFLRIARMSQVPDCHPSPFYFSKKNAALIRSKFTFRALLAFVHVLPLLACLSIEQFQTPFEKIVCSSQLGVLEKVINRWLWTAPRNPKRRTCSLLRFTILPSQEITTRRNYTSKKTTLLSSLTWQYALSCFRLKSPSSTPLSRR